MLVFIILICCIGTLHDNVFGTNGKQYQRDSKPDSVEAIFIIVTVIYGSTVLQTVSRRYKTKDYIIYEVVDKAVAVT